MVRLAEFRRRNRRQPGILMRRLLASPVQDLQQLFDILLGVRSVDLETDRIVALEHGEPPREELPSRGPVSLLPRSVRNG